ncbi:MAG: SdrD B-like domain-containing protein, partial [Bacteroidia bacterium]
MGSALFSHSQITGSVFRDFDGDGTKDGNEPLVPGVTVNAYNSSNTLCGSTTTSGNSSPNYSVSGCGTSDVRIEFVLPSGGFSSDSALDFSSLGADSYGSEVQFASGNSSNIDFAISYAQEYNTGTSNAELFVPIMNNGDPTAGGASGTETWFVGYPYGNSGTTTPTRTLNGTTIGTTFGVAYSAQAEKVFVAAFLKRHCGLGTMGSGGIYMLEPTASSFNVTSFYNMDANGHRTRASSGTYGSGSSYSIASNEVVTYLGSTDSESGDNVGLGIIGSNSNRGLSSGITATSYDPAAFDQVGKVGLGGITISDDGKYLYTVNLYNRKVYRLTLNDAANPTSVTAVSSFSLPSVSVTNGVLRPFGIKFYRNKVYVGAVSTAENGGSVTDMDAYVFELQNPLSGSPSFNGTAVLTVDLNYTKGRPMSWTGSSVGNRWYPWTNNSDDILIPATNEGTYPTPILSDIDFTDRGDMLLDFMDRSGHQWGWQNRRHLSSVTTEISYAIGGDLLIAGHNSSTNTYSLENDGDVTSINGQSLSSGSSNSQGVGGSEFFKGEFYSTSHEETSQGGVAVVPGSGEVVATVMDPDRIWSAGTLKFDIDDGSKVTNSEYELYYTTSGSNNTFGKSNGLGDIEVLKEEAPVGLGNRVWMDTDKDGIQDAGEAGIAGVSLIICSYGPDNMPGTDDDVALDSVITDADGNYYFTSQSGTDVTGITYGVDLDPDSSYAIKVSSLDWSVSSKVGTGDLEGYTLTNTNASVIGMVDASDNDASLSADDIAYLSVTLGDAGSNDYSLDFGFREYEIKIGNYVWVDANGNGVQDAGESPIEGVEVLLYDNAGNPLTSGGSSGSCDT